MAVPDKTTAPGPADPEGAGPADPEGAGPADPEGAGPADPEGRHDSDRKKPVFSMRRLFPLLLLATGIALVWVFDLHHWLSLENLKTYNTELQDFAALWWAPLAFIAVYTVATAFSLPGGAVLTVTGGFMFGILGGAVYAVTGATLGATLLFLVARTSLGEPLRAKAGPWMARAEAGFRKDAVSYLLFLRLVPAFPFVVVNLLPAFLGVRTWTYLWTTFVGIIPGSFVFVTVGAGLGSVIAQGEELTLQGVLTPEILIALAGLGLLALLPVVVKKLRGEKAA